jgi:hypothetical protein
MSARRKASKEPTKEDRTALRAAALPDDMAALLASAAEAIEAYHHAVMRCDDHAADDALTWVNAVVWKLNGGTMFGCKAHEDAPAYVVERHCAAVPGAVPKWGQRGEFVIEVSGMRALVEVGDGLAWRMHHLAFHAVDLHTPFISETGYRSHFAEPVGGVTVDQAVRGILAAMLKSQGRKMVEPQYRQRREQEAPRAWLRGLLAVGDEPAVFEDNGGQFAFGF